MSLALSPLSTLVSVACYKCGIEFALPTSFVKKRREDHADFYCPNGHAQHFVSKTEAELLREQLQREQRNHNWTRESLTRANREVAQKEAARRSQKAATTRLKKRVAAGRCPGCSTEFPDLAAHVAEAHPKLVKKGGTR